MMIMMHDDDDDDANGGDFNDQGCIACGVHPDLIKHKSRLSQIVLPLRTVFEVPWKED